MPAKLRKKYWTNTSHEQCSVRKINGKKSLIPIPTCIWHIVMACKTIFSKTCNIYQLFIAFWAFKFSPCKEFSLSEPNVLRLFAMSSNEYGFLIINHYVFVIFGLQGNKLTGLPWACVEHKVARKLQVLSMLFYSKVLRLEGILFSEFHELNHEYLDCLN